VDLDETLLLLRGFILRHLGCHNRISHVLFAHFLRTGSNIPTSKVFFEGIISYGLTAIDNPLNVGRQVLIMKKTYYAAQLGIVLSVGLESQLHPGGKEPENLEKRLIRILVSSALFFFESFMAAARQIGQQTKLQKFDRFAALHTLHSMLISRLIKLRIKME
jgi:hypothetical protein